MIVKLIGGRDCGTEIDTDDPGVWGGLPDPPLPEVLEVHHARSHRVAYRLVRVTPDECTYQIDPEATAAYRARWPHR